MWELEKAILVTNNDRVYEKYKDQMKVILLDGYEDVLIKVRDLVYDKHVEHEYCGNENYEAA